MKMKSILLVMLALCLTVCLCACGDDTFKDDNSPASTGTSKSTGAASTTTTITNTSTTTEAAQDTTDADSSVTTDAPVATQPVDGKANYTVTVVDEAGNPIPGVFVQMCLESCIPCITNAQGVASYPNMAVANYKVSFISIPEGYTSQANEYYFEKDAYAMTIVLKAN